MRITPRRRDATDISEAGVRDEVLCKILSCCFIETIFFVETELNNSLIEIGSKGQISLVVHRYRAISVLMFCLIQPVDFGISIIVTGTNITRPLSTKYLCEEFRRGCVSRIDFAIMVMIIEYACTNESALVYRAAADY